MRNCVAVRVWVCVLFLAVAVLSLPVYAVDTSEISAIRAKAEGGDASAQYKLSDYYAQGIGVPKDMVQAYKWLNLAAVKFPSAASAREQMAKEMTPQQIAEAQRLSAGFVSKRQGGTTISQPGSAPSAGNSLNSLTREKYKVFCQDTYKDFKSDPQSIAEKAKQVIIGMAGLEDKPQMHGIFEVDCVFNANTMLMLVACANRIKREPKFIEEYKTQSTAVRSKLKTEDERIFLDAFTALIVSQQKEL
jgi:hypothetical protein